MMLQTPVLSSTLPLLLCQGSLTTAVKLLYFVALSQVYLARKRVP